MGRVRRWLPGIAVVLLLVNAGGLLGGRLGLRFWPFFLGFACFGLLTLGYLAYARGRARSPLPRKLRAPRRPGTDAYDLESDTSTDEQRWLM